MSGRGLAKFFCPSECFHTNTYTTKIGNKGVTTCLYKQAVYFFHFIKMPQDNESCLESISSISLSIVLVKTMFKYFVCILID